MTRLSQSIERSLQLLADADLSVNGPVHELLAETSARRTLALSDLDPNEQTDLIASRAVDLLPSHTALRDAIASADSAGTPLVVKFGIDPTSPDVHLGHAVPMILLSRFQRMGHRVILIVGDITAKIGDPSGRSADRPKLTDQQIARNLQTYRDQISPFFDFEQADFRYNGEWLAKVQLPELIEILAEIPVSMSLQREDFRTRLERGHGLSMSEFIYSVVMALDSVRTNCSVEIGGVDQLLNMQMCRKVMEVVGQKPELVVTTPLIQGTDGTGGKMSKSKGNYVALTAPAGEIFGKLMAIPDRLMVEYLRAWTEWTDLEIDAAMTRLDRHTLHPMDLKKLLAGEAVAAIHDLDAAMKAREEFTAQFSRRVFAKVEYLPVVNLRDSPADSVGLVLSRTLVFTPSLSAARRVARQNGLRIVLETDGEQRVIPLPEEAVQRSLAEVTMEALSDAGLAPDIAHVYLRAGRKVARIEGTSTDTIP